MIHCVAGPDTANGGATRSICWYFYLWGIIHEYCHLFNITEFMKSLCTNKRYFNSIRFFNKLWASMMMMLPFQVSKINDIELTMTFELYFDLSWTESRFLINESSTKWGEVTSSASFSLLGIIKYCTVLYGSQQNGKR